MNKHLYFDWAGMSFRVEVEIFDDEPAYVEEIKRVEVKTEGGEYMLVSVDKAEFMDNMQDILNDAAEEYMRDRAIAYAEMRADAKREEVLK